MLARNDFGIPTRDLYVSPAAQALRLARPIKVGRWKANYTDWLPVNQWMFRLERGRPNAQQSQQTAGRRTCQANLRSEGLLGRNSRRQPGGFIDDTVPENSDDGAINSKIEREASTND